MARRKHNAAVKRKLIAKGNNNVKMDRNADLKSYALSFPTRTYASSTPSPE